MHLWKEPDSDFELRFASDRTQSSILRISITDYENVVQINKCRAGKAVHMFVCTDDRDSKYSSPDTTRTFRSSTSDWNRAGETSTKADVDAMLKRRSGGVLHAGRRSGEVLVKVLHGLEDEKEDRFILPSEKAAPRSQTSSKKQIGGYQEALPEEHEEWRVFVERVESLTQYEQTQKAAAQHHMEVEADGKEKAMPEVESRLRQAEEHSRNLEQVIARLQTQLAQEIEVQRTVAGITARIKEELCLAQARGESQERQSAQVIGHLQSQLAGEINLRRVEAESAARLKGELRLLEERRKSEEHAAAQQTARLQARFLQEEEARRGESEIIAEVQERFEVLLRNLERDENEAEVCDEAPLAIRGSVSPNTQNDQEVETVGEKATKAQIEVEPRIHEEDEKTKERRKRKEQHDIEEHTRLQLQRKEEAEARVGQDYKQAGIGAARVGSSESGSWRRLASTNPAREVPTGQASVNPPASAGEHIPIELCAQQAAVLLGGWPTREASKRVADHIERDVRRRKRRGHQASPQRRKAENYCILPN